MPVRIALVCAVLVSPCMAGEDEADENFFEFIAGLEQVDGEWVDPMDLPPVQQPVNETAEENDE